MTAVHQESDLAPARVVALPSYQSRRSRRHAAQRRRLALRVMGKTSPAAIAPDPLFRPQPKRLKRFAVIGLLVVGSLGLHAAMLFGFAVVSQAILRGRGLHVLVNDKVEVAVIEEEPPPPPPEPLPKEETRKAPAPVVTPTAEPEAKKPEPPADPISKPEERTPTAATPRRIVGLSLESTTTGGGGPAFAVGNTRMGSTDAVAKDPSAVNALVAQENRASNRVPTAKVAFKPPQKTQEVKPEYPAALRTQGVEADVVLAVVVSVDGTVVKVEVVKAPPEAEFAAAAVSAAKAERYAPATKDGVPIEQLITFTVRFRLTDY